MIAKLIAAVLLDLHFVKVISVSLSTNNSSRVNQNNFHYVLSLKRNNECVSDTFAGPL